MHVTVTSLPISSCRMHQDQIMLVAQGNLVSEDAEVTKEVSETVSDPPSSLHLWCALCRKNLQFHPHHNVVGAYITSSVFKIDLYRLLTKLN